MSGCHSPHDVASYAAGQSNRRGPRILTLICRGGREKKRRAEEKSGWESFGPSAVVGMDPKPKRKKKKEKKGGGWADVDMYKYGVPTPYW